MSERILSFFKSSKENENNVLNFMEDDLESNDQTSMIKSVKNNIKESIEVETNYTNFFIVFSVGIILIILSTIFLPMVIIFPTKFVSLFSLGSIITVFSFIFVYGTSGYFSKLFEGKRSFYTLLYFSSIVVGFYFSYFNPNYLICLISAVVQIIMLIVFVLSFIPGGESGISFIFHGLKTIGATFWGKLFSK